jgi:hypothetical protein
MWAVSESVDVQVSAKCRAAMGEVPMFTKWMLENKLALRVITSGAGMTALAVVLAAPTKWKL